MKNVLNPSSVAVAVIVIIKNSSLALLLAIERKCSFSMSLIPTIMPAVYSKCLAVSIQHQFLER